jgi:uncharacterized protein YndB with AHSA1/START domain
LTTIVTEIHITRPPDEVFAYMRDYANQAVWQAPHVTEVVVEPPGPAQLGTMVHKLRKTPMGKQRLNERVVEIDEAARHWAEVTVDGPLRGSRVTWQVEAEQDGSPSASRGAHARRLADAAVASLDQPRVEQGRSSRVHGAPATP